MYDASLVGMTQGQSGFPQNSSGYIKSDRPLLQELVERVSSHVLHDEVDQASLTLYSIDRNDVGMIQLGRSLGLLLKPGNELGIVRHIRRQHLDGNLPLQYQVLSQEDHSHAAPPEQLDDLVTASQCAREPLCQLIGWVRRTDMGDFTRWGAAVGAEAAIHRERRVTPGTLVHRMAPFCLSAPRCLPADILAKPAGRLQFVPTAAQME
jgi:hypothetical protein